MEKRFFIQGMSCSSCANHIETAVNKLDGIKGCNVSLLLNQMDVSYDESKVNEITIINAVIDAGYNATTQNISLENNQLKNKRNRMILSLILLIPLWIVSMFIKNIYSTIIQIVLSTIILFINRKQLINGIKTLFKFKPTMDSLVALGSLTSYLYSFYLVIIKETMFYFDASCMVICFVSIGKYLESLSSKKTTNALDSLIKLTPKKAIKLENNIQHRINVNDIKVNDVLLIKPGNSIPVDCIVLEGNSYIDSSSITGESIPKEVSVNSKLISSTINLNNPLKVKALKEYKDSTYSKILDLVLNASNSKAEISRLADTISKIFIPFVIVISIIVGIIWYITTKDLTNSIIHIVNCLVVSCPCSLGLATPTAIMVATGLAAKNGIIFKEAKYIEELSKIDTIVLDKTNTITNGYPQVVNFKLFNPSIINIIYNIESSVNHPLSKPIIEYIEKNYTIESISIGNIENIVSKGLKCIYKNDIYLIGNYQLLKENNIKFNEIDSINTVVYVSKNNKVEAIIELFDTLKEDSIDVINVLNKKFDLHLLSGDNKLAVEYIGKIVNINNLVSQVTPIEKYELIKKLQSENKRVCMVGDGINDTVALSKANIGIAINNSSDIAIESSDIVINTNNLTGLLNAINISNKAIKIIKENLFWALGYNLLLIPIASGLFESFGIKLMPAYCAIAMSLSSITVISNALRINSYKPISFDLNNKNGKYEYLIKIDTMTCIHCVNNIKNALLNLNIIAECNLKDSTAHFFTNKLIDENELRNQIEQSGYKLVNIKTKIV